MLVALAMRVYLILALAPGSDVYYYDSQAAQLLARGVSPYGHEFTGIPPQLATPGAQNVFAYFPFTATFLVPFYFLGDVRLATVAADLIIGACLFQFSRKSSLLVATLFLLVPLTYYTNDAVLAAALVAVAFALESRGRKLLSALSLGVALATSLFVWLAVPFFAYGYARRGNAKLLLAALAVFAVIVFPFFVADPSSFLYDVLFYQLGRGAPGLLTPGGAFGFTLNPSLSGLLVTLAGQSAPLYLRAAIALLFLALIFRNRPRAQDAAAGGPGDADITSWVLLRSSAFVAVAILVVPSVFFFAYAEFPIVLFLIWLAMR